MTDSMDKKLKEKRDNLDVDLDAMLDKAESSFLPANESQDENDDLDRLLIDSDFDADDQSMQADTAIERNTYPDELDDFLSFDNFDDDVGEAQNTPPVDNLFSSAQTNENAYEEDDLDRLLMNTALDSDNRTPQVEEEENEDDLLEELDDFSNFSDFNAPELTPTEDAEQSELPAESLFAHINTALAGAIADDLDPDEALSETNWLQNDAAELEQLIELEDELDEFSDFSDFNEPDIITAFDSEEPESVADLMAAAEPEQPITTEDELNEFSDFSDFNEPDAAVDDSEWLQDEEAVADFEQPIAVETAPADELDAAIDEALAELTPAAEIDELTAAETVPIEELDAAVDDTSWLQDEEAIANFEQPIAAETAAADELDTTIDEALAELTPAAEIEQPVELEDELDEFSDFSDFNEPDAAVDDSDWLQEEDAVSDFEQPITAETAATDELDTTIDEALAELTPAAEIDEPIAAETAPAEELDTTVDDNWLPEEDAVSDFEQPIAAETAPDEETDAAVDDTSWLQDEEAVANFEQPIAAETAPAEELDTAVDDTSWLQDEESVANFEQPIAAKTAPAEQLDAAVDDTSWLQAAAAPVEEIDAAVDDSNWLQDDKAVTAPDEADTAFDDADWLQGDEELTPPATESTALDDELDDFSGLDAGFDDSDLIQDDETELATQNPTDSLQDDDDSFNSLFADSDFNDGDTIEPTDTNNAVSGDDVDLSEIDDFFKLDEVSDDFSKQLLEAEALASAEQVQDDKDNQDDFLLPDFDITADNETMGTDDDSPIPEDEFADAFGDTSFLDKAETEPPTQQESSENKTAATDTVAMENIVNVRLSPFEFEQEEIKKQLEVTEKKLKKAKIFSYVALGFGAVALTAAIGLGVMTYKAKTEVSSLTGVVTNLEQSLKNSAEGNSKEAINTMLNSVVQLNQQIYDFINDLKGNPQLPADALNNKVPGIAEKQVMVSNALKTLRGKIGDLDEATLSELSIVESPKEPTKIEIQPTPAKESHNTLMPPVKTEAVIEPIASPKTVVPEPPPIAAKEAPKVEVAAKVKIKAEVVKPKPVISAKTADRELSKPSAGGNWGVNLVAFKQEWFAQSKAAEFARQGVYADVIPIQGDGGTMYRLRVGGFASKKEANASKDKIRRVLNLDSVWVSDN